MAQDLSTILETREKDQLATNFDNCKTQQERGQCPNNPPEFGPLDVEGKTVENREIKIDYRWSGDFRRQDRASHFLDIKEEPSTPWGVSRGDSVNVLEFFYTEKPGDISTAIDLIPKFTSCEFNGDELAFKPTTFTTSPERLCKIECDLNELNKSYISKSAYVFKFINKKEIANSLKFGEAFTLSDDNNILSQKILPKTRLYDTENLKNMYCVFRPFQLSIFIPFVMSDLYDTSVISDEVLVCTSSQMNVNRVGKTRKQIWKETRRIILERYYPEKFHREFKNAFSILCNYELCPQHRLFGKDNIPLEILKIILGYVKEESYFKNLKLSSWRHNLPRKYLKKFNTRENHNKKIKIEKF